MKSKARGLGFGLDLLAIAGLLIAHAGITEAHEKPAVLDNNSPKSDYAINMSVRKEMPERGVWLKGTFVPGWSEWWTQNWFREGQLGLIVSGGSRHQGTYKSAGGFTKVEVGYCCPQVVVLGWDSGRIHVDVSLKVSSRETDEEDRTVVQSCTLRAKEWVVVGKKVKYVLTRDSGGKPESWMELTIRSSESPQGDKMQGK